MSFPRVYVTDLAEIWLLEFLIIHVTLSANPLLYMEIISLNHLTCCFVGLLEFLVINSLKIA